MLCAINSGYIGRCYAWARWWRRRTRRIGWKNSGVIEDCYTQGDVEEMAATRFRWSICRIGRPQCLRRHVRTCYSTCVVAMYDGAALVAANDGGAVEHCFWDADAIGIRIDAVGKGLSTQEMMNGTIMWSDGMERKSQLGL